MARSVILLDASVEDRVEELHRKMDSVLRLLSGGANAPQPEEPDWLTAQAFCERSHRAVLNQSVRGGSRWGARAHLGKQTRHFTLCRTREQENKIGCDG